MTIVFGGDAVQAEVDAALRALENHERVPERRRYDFKEEAGRRGRDGSILPGVEQNETAAQKLAPEVACMANTPGGGALVLGVADDLTLIGTALDVDWLQTRLYELLDRRITTVIFEREVGGVRLLVIRSPHAVEPVAWKNRVTWRVGDQCQDIDAGTWMDRRAQGWGYDWSAQPSTMTVDDVRAAAVEVARTFLRSTADERAADLAAASTPDLLRRLAVVAADGTLTNAGVVLFVGRGVPALDYVRRSAAGADNEARVRREGVSLLEELSEVFTTVRAYNPEVHIDRGLVIDRVRLLPERAVREAVVNGVAHREWTDPAATWIEHVGSTLRVVSPGGFYGGVRSDNIINHPPRSRNGTLARVLATLRVAESQGIGVDRMYGDMLRLGHPAPTIIEQDGTQVLAVLAGERPDTAWMEWLTGIGPADVSGDLRLLMAVHRLVQQWWTDADDLAPYLQVTRDEASQVVARVRDLRRDGEFITFDVDGVPAARDCTVLGLTDRAWDALVVLSDRADTPRRGPSRETVALTYARHAGRISTTELGSIVGAHATNVGTVLRSLEDAGTLAPSRENRRGPGFFYRYVKV